MIVWLNGAFGVGKTCAARELVDLIPGSTLYEPELIGRELGRLLPEKRYGEVSDYQDLPSWRRLVVDTAAALLMEVGGPLVAPMALLREEYRDEIFGGLAARGIPVRHILLHADETILRRRVDQRQEVPGDPETSTLVRLWCLEHLPAYQAALPWLRRDAHELDVAALSPREVAERVAAAVADGAGACGIVQTPEPSGETVAAAVLLFDEQDRVLLVDPTYKPGWEFPGGVVERGEPPARAGVREVAEELGVHLQGALHLLVVDWEPPAPPGFGGLRLVFDGGRLPPGEAGRPLLPAAELRGWRFATEEEAAALLPAHRFARLRWALRAREQGRTLNLEAGRPVD